MPHPRSGRRRDRTRSTLDDSLRSGSSSAMHFDVPVAGGGEVISVDCHGVRTTVFVDQGIDGTYSTESVRGRFQSIDQLIHALGASWPSPCTVVGSPSDEEEEHVGSSASAQTPHPDGLQHLDFRDLPFKEQHAAEPASAQTLCKLDLLSLKDLRHPTAMDVSPTIATSLPSPCQTIATSFPSRRHTIEASPPSGRSLSSSPIWKKCDFIWEMTFHTIKDLGGYFRIFPHVGGPFRSKDEAYKGIARYLAEHEDPSIGRGLSEVDKLIQHCRYFPDGTKRRLKAGQQIDKRRDANYQLVQAVLYKYNEHHNLSGDRAYEVKYVPDKPVRWEEENCRMYIHMNFTAKTKVSDDNMFFTEITHGTGKGGELTVNCCCIVKHLDNGPCLGCETSVKHPNDGNAYTGGRMNATYSQPFGPSWCRDYNEDSDEEVERLRFLFGGAPATAGVPLEV
ncbi:hypothetical protein QYE76_050115 [Lolium multiflorum]|uniref:DUF3615 domain-containing protein n=2 Tax=Lolium TaxID=4520 RepID=A0AAD8SR39_LOLMU|nr:hypothetical protein QYE76_050115 [Lolium multiflorum]